MLLMGFAGAFRRSELARIDVEDLELESRGYVVHLRNSKTDQEGAGRDVAIPYGSNPQTCPVRSLGAWLERAQIASGAVFRRVDRHGRVLGRISPATVAAVVKRWAEEVGVDPGAVAGHSLRSGLATSAAAAGKSERAIMAQTGHRSSAMVRRYIKRASLFDECGATGIGL
jgi:integrase